ncbi:hypothetical protein [Janthinobacterium sp. JC611]|nr:hypothetical protein [Janthinobacterium sp. JC611]
MARNHKRLAGGNWRMDDTEIKNMGVWKYLSRVFDKQDKIVDVC